MSINVRMVRTAAPTTATTQEFTVAGMGTPKAAMFIVTGAIAEGAGVVGARIGIGFTDGTRNFYATSSSNDFVANAVAKRYSQTGSCIGVLLANGTAVDGEATFVDWDPGGVNGVRITWTNPPATALLVTCILFGDTIGTDLSAYVGDFNGNINVGSSTDVTAPGFMPDHVIMLSIGHTAYAAIAADFKMELGFAARSTLATQCSLNMRERDTANFSEGTSVACTNRATHNPDSGVPRSIELTDFDASGFSAFSRDAGAQVGGVPIKYMYLALKYNGTCNNWTGVVDSPITPPAAPTNRSFTNPGFKPQFVLQLTTPIVNSLTSPGTPPNGYMTVSGGLASAFAGTGSFAISAFNATERFINAVTDDDGLTTMDTASRVDMALACWNDNLASNPGTAITHAGILSTFDTTGWTMTFTTLATASVFKWPTLAIGEFTAPAASSIAAIQNSYRQRRM